MKLSCDLCMHLDCVLFEWECCKWTAKSADGFANSSTFSSWAERIRWVRRAQRGRRKKRFSLLFKAGEWVSGWFTESCNYPVEITHSVQCGVAASFIFLALWCARKTAPLSLTHPQHKIIYIRIHCSTLPQLLLLLVDGATRALEICAAECPDFWSSFPPFWLFICAKASSRCSALQLSQWRAQSCVGDEWHPLKLYFEQNVVAPLNAKVYATVT